MKLNILSFILLHGIMSCCVGQIKTTLWSKYPTTGGKFFNAMTQLPDGSFIAVGNTDDGKWLLVNIDQNGYLLWQKTIGAVEYGSALNVIPDKNGDFLVLGSWKYDINEPFLPMESKLAKFDKSGETLWEKIFSKGSYSALDGLMNMGDGYLLFGLYNSGKDYTHENRNLDSWIVRVDANGEILWEKTIEGPKDNGINDIIELKNEQLLAIGFNTVQGRKFEDKENCQTTLTHISKDGDIINSKTICGSGLEMAERIIQTPDNGCLILGFTYSKDFRNRKPQEGEKVNDDISICKLNQQFEIEWIKKYGGSGYDSFRDCIETKKGLLILGKSNPEDGDFSSSNGEGKVVVFEINWNGKIKWANKFNGTGTISSGAAIKKIDSNTFIVAGHSFPNGAWIFAFKKEVKK